MLISERARMKKRYHQWFARPEACQLAPLRIHVVATCLNTCMSAPAIINMYVYAVHVCVLFSYETSHTHKGVISVFMCSWQSCNTCVHTHSQICLPQEIFVVVFGAASLQEGHVGVQQPLPEDP